MSDTMTAGRENEKLRCILCIAEDSIATGEQEGINV
jgi:hypothetical protein